jgi:ribonuclease BN (tRNA processing enzyme)
LFFQNIDKFLEIREKFKDIYEESIKIKDKDIKSIKILGAYGSRAKGFGTSSFALNSKNLIDAGNILLTLDEQSADVENIWITHSHLDHISDIAYVLDNYYPLRSKSLNILALPETIKSLQECFFNDSIWADFSKIKMYNSDEYSLKYIPLELYKEYQISDTETIMPFQTDHTIESCGYIYKKENHAVLITADTYSLDNVLDIIDKTKEIKSIVIECSFPSSMSKLAKESKHLTPKLLFDALKKLKRDDLALYINHIKPTYLDEIVKEIEQLRGKWNPIILKDEDFINF